MDIRGRVQVCVPFSRLREELLPHFAAHRLNPEIGIDAPALERFALEDFAAVAEVLREHRLTVTLHAPFVDLSAGSTDPAIRAVTRRRFEEILRLVPLFAPLTVVAHAGYQWQRYGYFRKSWIELSTAFWTEIAERLNRAGSRLMLENVYEEDPAEIRELFERLHPAGVGLCLDCGHLTAFGKAPLGEWIEALGAFIGQLHLHDNRGQKDDHLPLGRGVIDFPRLFDYLKTAPQRPVMTLEIHEPDGLWASLAYLERLWPWPEAGGPHSGAKEVS
ncbi:MAG: sugar phosphate isomerase/epimerase [Desulfobacterales bacterium]|jgi:sugar phosphate isomerase/epimerase|nr:sugar phosphate isomerase/epimerase [Desulfobacterales bacterium]